MSNLSYIRSQIYKPNVNKLSLISLVKKDLNYQNVDGYIRKLPNHPLIKHLINQSLIPSSLDKLGKGKVIPYTNNLEGELSWITYPLKKSKEKLLQFLTLKEEFEKYFFQHDFDNCKNLLNRIDKEICYSVFNLNNRFLVRFKENGIKSVRDYWSSISVNISDPIALVLLAQSTKRFDHSLNYERFFENFQEEISHITNVEALQQYFGFKLGIPSFVKLENLSHFCALESTSSLIDRYQFIKDVVFLLVSIPSKQQLVKDLLHYLGDDIVEKDSFYRNVDSYINDKVPSLKLHNADYNDLNSAFLNSNYIKCIGLIQKTELVKEYRLSILNIYVTSLIQEGLEYQDISNANEFNDLGRLLYDALTISSIKEAINGIQNYANEFSHTEKGKYLFLLVFTLFLRVKKIDDFRELHIKLACQSSSIYQSIIESNSSLSLELKKEYLISNGIRLDEINTEQQELSNLFLKFFSKDYETTLRLSEELLSKNLTRYFQYQIYYCYFISLLETGDLARAISLYVSFYLNDKDLVDALRENEFDKHFFDNGTLSLKEASLSSANLITILNYEDYYRFIAYDEYLESLQIEKPSQINTEGFSNKSELIYFLASVCTIDVMKHSITFDSLEEVYLERTALLSELVQIHDENSENYIKELNSLTQDRLINEAIREVNKGRITFNKERIKQHVLSENKDLFSHYLELAKQESENDWLDVDFTNSSLNKIYNQKDKDVKIISLKDPSYVSFKNLVSKIRDAFLYSKEYGLDGYLSTRIRHGTLQNHIRSVFENQHLVSFKDTDGNYKANKYWRESVDESIIKDIIDSIEHELEKFSTEIDNFTELIIKEYIQVSSEKQLKEKALFKYEFPENTYATIYAHLANDLEDENYFLDLILEYIRRLTLINIENIKDMFTNQIKEEFSGIINQLDTRIQDIVGAKHIPELSASIKKSGTEIIKELRSISEWFGLNTPSDSEYDLNTILMTAITITNGYYPNYVLEPNIEVDDIMVGQPVSTHLVYIFRILLDNIIMHSKVDSDKQDVNIKIRVTDKDFVSIDFTNILGEEVDQVILNNKLGKVSTHWSSSASISERINIEGGSGFEKISRILGYDIDSKDYALNYSIVENKLTISIQCQIKFYPNV